MSLTLPLALAILLPILALAAYADRVYSEMGKFLAREYQDNIDAWEERVEPRLGLGRESVALSASVLRQLTLAAIAFLLGLRFVGNVLFSSHRFWPEFGTTTFELVLLILVFDRLIPQVLFARTKGVWAARLRFLFQALFFFILPITLFLQLMLSIVALAEPEDSAEDDHPDEAMDALLEAGEEEGILEQSDRELVRSVVEFGDKVVREVMTPRPEIFAVPGTLTLQQFTAELEEHVYSRVPVFLASLDDITGIVFAHDLLQVSDTDATTRTVAQLQRPAAFVPETKMVAELLREMQSEKQHMRLVIDEYGAVAGLVTIEDLLEAIVGSIADEHDEPEDEPTALPAPDGSFIVPGTFEVSRLRDLFEDAAQAREQAAREQADRQAAARITQNQSREAGSATAEALDGEDQAPEPTPLRLPEGYESTTVGGLVSEMAGHIPLPGEVVEEDGLRLEVLRSTDRKIESIRVSLAD